MSVVSSRVSNLSSILKSPGVRSQLMKQSNRVYFKLPKNIKNILFNFENRNGIKDYEDLICTLRNSNIKVNNNKLFYYIIQVKIFELILI